MTAPAQETGAFVVTLKDVWHEVSDGKQKTADALNAMATSISEMSGRLGGISESMQVGSQHRADLEARVRVLEKWRYQLPVSLGMSIIALAAVLIDLISTFR